MWPWFGEAVIHGCGNWNMAEENGRRKCSVVCHSRGGQNTQAVVQGGAKDLLHTLCLQLETDNINLDRED